MRALRAGFRCSRQAATSPQTVPVRSHKKGCAPRERSTSRYESLAVPIVAMMPMTSMMSMIVAPRPQVEVNARAVVAVVPVAWTAPMAAVPIAPVAHLLDLRAFARCGLEVSRKPAGGRGLSRHREESESKGGDRPSE